MVLAVDATIDVQGAAGKRKIKATDFITGIFSNALHEGEIIIAIRVPVPPEGTKTTYQKFVQPASRFAVVGCAVVRYPDGKINIGFTGVSDNAFRASTAEAALSGNAINDDSIAAAGNAAVQGIIFLSDNFASAEYRKHLTKVYLKKALQAVA
jgi:carbon-monoxide dehydrogenase medium subunit